MKYKLIAIDIDGTLLNSRSELTPRTREALRLAMDKGALPVISTGRPMQGVERMGLIFDEDMPVITYNGAAVVMSRSKKRLLDAKLPPELCLETIALGLERGVSVNVWVDDALYAASDTDKNELYRQVSKQRPVLGADMPQIVCGGASKVLWCDGADVIDKCQADMRTRFGDRLNCHTSSPTLLEFVSREASKAAAMERIGALYGIDRSEMIAVGDGHNDISMLEYAGLGVAMANAPQAVKDKAGFVTLSNDEDGVAHVIEKFIL